MKKILVVSLATIAIGVLSASSAKAGIVFGLSIGVSAPPMYVAPAPVYAPPVYAQPVYRAPVCAPAAAPVYVYPEPVYVAPPPVVYAPPAVVIGPTFGFFGHSHWGGHRFVGHHRHW